MRPAPALAARAVGLELAAGALATGAGSNLLVRAAHVTLKERRPLIVCHREMPLNLIDIENMRTLTLAGASNTSLSAARAFGA